MAHTWQGQNKATRGACRSQKAFQARPRNKKTALIQPARWEELRATYDQAQELLEGMKAEGLDPIKWVQENMGPVGSVRYLGGSDGHS